MHQKEASMLHGERVEVTDPSNGLDSARGSIVSSRDSRLAVEGEGFGRLSFSCAELRQTHRRGRVSVYETDEGVKIRTVPSTRGS